MDAEPFQAIGILWEARRTLRVSFSSRIAFVPSLASTSNVGVAAVLIHGIARTVPR